MPLSPDQLATAQHVGIDPSIIYRAQVKGAELAGTASPEGYKNYQDALKAAGGSVQDVDTTAQMNPKIEAAKKNVVDAGSMTPEQIQAQQLEGVDKSSQLANSDTMKQQAQGLGGDIDYGMQSAIANRQNKLYSSSLNNISQSAKLASPLIQAQRRQAAMAGMASVEDLKTQAANTQLVKYQNDQAERNALLNSILGLGGAIAGFAVGGPKGAAAGAALGSGVGKLAAGGGPTQTQALASGGDNSASYFGGK